MVLHRGGDLGPPSGATPVGPTCRTPPSQPLPRSALDPQIPCTWGTRAFPTGAATTSNYSEGPPDLCRPTPMPDRGPGLEKVEILPCRHTCTTWQEWCYNDNMPMPMRAFACRTRSKYRAPPCPSNRTSDRTQRNSRSSRRRSSPKRSVEHNQARQRTQQHA